jgi:hypothetical protein
MTRIAICLAGLALCAVALADTTANVPLQVSVTNPTATAAGAVTVFVGATSAAVAIPAVPPPVTTPPAAGIYWVYQNGVKRGVFDLDVSFAGSANYSDTLGVPTSGRFDIAFTGSQYNGGWQLMSSKCQSSVRACVDTTRYQYLILQIKPTVAGQQWQIGFMSSGDTPDGNVIDISQYGPRSVVSQWSSFKIPLSAFKLSNTKILKFWLQGNTSGATKFYVDDVGSSPN